jgi:hypothetical protein
MEKENIKDIVPSTLEINTSTPGVLALERFKLAQSIQDDSKEAKNLKDVLLENKATD